MSRRRSAVPSNTEGANFAIPASSAPSLPLAQADSGAPWHRLRFGIDSAYWHIGVDKASLQEFRDRFWAGAYPALAERQCKGHLGYEFGIVVAHGLNLYVAPVGNQDMGLWVQAGDPWLAERSPLQWEPELRELVASWGLTITKLALRRVDPAVDVLWRDEFPQFDLTRDFVARARAGRMWLLGARRPPLTAARATRLA